ncbi:MAG: thioesterase family protein [Acidimicrobiales bacterium]
MGEFDAETAIEPVGSGRWSTRLHAGWNIGDRSNGGYALIPVLRAMRELVDRPDPISATTHFLRPCEGGTDGEVRAEIVRAGRSSSTLRGDLSQGGTCRLAVLAAFGDLSEPAGVEAQISVPPPDLPAPDDCVHRSGLEQGVELPIMSRIDVRLRPEHAVAGGSEEAVVEGWIKLSDGTEPESLSLPFFADAFPPSLHSMLGRVGWVPTVELTVHVRRRPAPGWLRARLECDDLLGGRMIETGSVWDSSGALVARCRQIGLLLAR